ncbi:hypothetical protein NUH87_25705 [Pseudomonas batumici]|uniref:hypothetical protein n=1 Tax=Pseudomonas batumici TaxID=226910 RepID=UPI0030CB78B4
MELNTYDSLIQWLSVKPRTSTWDALIAYDRDQANRLLRQEYIERFNTASYFPLFNEDIQLSRNSSTVVIGYLLDAPVLSFQGANINSSMVDFTMKVMGGTQFAFGEPEGGERYINKIAALDALDGQRVTATTELNLQNDEPINSIGQVVLNTSKGTNFQVWFAKTYEARVIGGASIKEFFDNLDDTVKKFELSRIVIREEDFLKPESFKLRTHGRYNPGPGAPITDEGAVLMFVTMQGGTDGDIPSSNEALHYLIPSDRPYSSAMLLGHRFFMQKMFVEGCKRMHTGSTPFTAVVEGIEEVFVTGVRATSGERVTSWPAATLAHFSKFQIARLSMNLFKQANPDAATLVLNFVSGKIRLAWKGSGEQEAEVITTAGGQTHRASMRVAWVWEEEFELRFRVDGEGLELISTQQNRQAIFKAQPGGFATIAGVAEYFPEIAEYVEASLLPEACRQAMAAFAEPILDINAVALHSLLFHSNNAVKLLDARQPGDLIYFSDIAPNRLAFEISPLETLIGPGRRFQFKTTPARSDITWRVENINNQDNYGRLSDESYPGKIEPDGWYTAPVLAQIPGQFKRVRIVAEAPGNMVSYALVTVVVRDITVNPLIQMASAGEEDEEKALELSAGTLVEGNLVWSIANQEDGARVYGSNDKEMKYMPGPKVTGKYYHIDEVKVSVTKDGVETTQSSYVLVAHRPANMFPEVLEAYGLPDNQIKLVVYGEDGEVFPGIRWEHICGSGEVNADGVFTQREGDTNHFAVITAFLPGPMNYTGFIILPLPLVKKEQFIKLLKRK